MRTIIALSFLSLVACTAEPAPTTLGTTDSALRGNHSGVCHRTPDEIDAAFAAFDGATSPSTLGAPADVVLAPWLDFLAPDVVFEAGNAPALVGRAAVASYFAPLLPMIGTTTHELATVSPGCDDDTWLVRGTLHLTRRADGRAITPIPFTDTLTLGHDGTITRYEIRFDPSPIGELFAP